MDIISNKNRFIAGTSPCRHNSGQAGFLFLLLLSLLFCRNQSTYASEEKILFNIKGFIVEGNTLLAETPLYDDPESPFNKFPTIQTVLEGFIGSGKTYEELEHIIEEARNALEITYHELGYPTVLVNIPDQTLDDGFVRLQVIESVVRRVRVTGNRYFTMEKILRDLPTLQEGEILYLPHLQEELMLANRNPDLRVEPLLIPGKEFGTVDVELKVKDQMPLHGSLELNNRASANTTDLRLNGMLSYDNLWQQDHSLSLQYQTAPQDTKEVQVLAASYVLPTPWNDDHRLAFFSVWSDSDTAFGEGFQTKGKGYIFGSRYVMPLLPYNLYSHNISVGIDYKDFEEVVQFDTETLITPVTYMPLTFSYSSSLQGKTGVTYFSSSLNMSFRDAVSDQDEFAIKGFKARSNYIYLTSGIERMQKLPWKSSLYIKINGQLSDQPLISNEQFSAGGMDSVRGYKESSSAGDDAFHTTIELVGPDLAEVVELSLTDKTKINPYIFYDMASLAVKDPLPGQHGSTNLQGAGLGLRGAIGKYFEYETDWAWALRSQGNVESGDTMFNFKLKARF